MIIKTRSYPRAALIGNPSDGYFGKTIALTFSNFKADITLYPSKILRILPGRRDVSSYNGIDSLNTDVDRFGYYGGLRLIKAAIRKFYLWSQNNNIELNKDNFTIRYHSNIPLHLGMAGSSAIITATIKALKAFYQISIESALMANLVLSVETEELKLEAGLQDRVAQAFQGITFMDFDKLTMEKQKYGNYSPVELNPEIPLFIAFKKENSEGSEIVHNNLRYRYDKGEAAVLRAMDGFAAITVDFKEAYTKGDYDRVHKLMNENFNLRKSIMKISTSNLEMVNIARDSGASAKFTGSGGAIIGCYKDASMLNELRRNFEKMGIELIIPQII